MRIGLPSALLTPYYLTFWKPFFEELGVEVVESGITTKTILDKGVRNSVPDLCVPIKTYIGHVLDLWDKGVNYIYVPRFVSIRKADTFCPKFLALPDMLKCSFPMLGSKLLTHHLISDSDNIATENNYMEIGKNFTKDKKQIRTAIKRSKEKWQEFRNRCCLDGNNCQEANEIVLAGTKIAPENFAIKIGVIGYVYNIYDSFVSMNILNKLRNLRVNTVTFETVKSHHLDKQLHKFRKKPFWTFSNKILAAAYCFLENETIDGVIHVTAFGCGPDSFLGKMLELDSTEYKKPFMTIRVDEHTGENHLQTRVEAFVDMIAKKKLGMVYA